MFASTAKETTTFYTGALVLDDGTEAYCGALGCRVHCDGGATVSVKFGGWEVVCTMNTPAEVLGTRILRSPLRTMMGDSARAKAHNEGVRKAEIELAARVERAAVAKVIEVGLAQWPDVYSVYAA